MPQRLFFVAVLIPKPVPWRRVTNHFNTNKGSELNNQLALLILNKSKKQGTGF